jgi:NDP-sugar pyrophosphorylase family protein
MILAAGKGTRLGPLTTHIPKVMLPVGGKPVLERNVEWLAGFGITELMINLCHLPQTVQEYFKDGSRWGASITYSLESEPLGTAGGVKNVEWFFDQPFIVWYGDNLCTCNLDRLAHFHQSKGGIATIALYRRPDVTASGIAGLDQENRILRFVEKPPSEQVFSHWINAGLYVLEPRIFEYIPRCSDFGRDVFPALLAREQPIYGYRMSPGENLWWIDTPEDLERVKLQMDGRKK